MATTEELLQSLVAVKSGVRAALSSKGCDMTGVPFSNYPEKIMALDTAEGEDDEGIIWLYDRGTLADGYTLNLWEDRGDCLGLNLASPGQWDLRTGILGTISMAPYREIIFEAEIDVDMSWGEFQYHAIFNGPWNILAATVGLFITTGPKHMKVRVPVDVESVVETGSIGFGIECNKTTVIDASVYRIGVR